MGENDFREELPPIEEIPVPVGGADSFEMGGAGSTDIDGPDAAMQEQASADDVNMGGPEASETAEVSGGIAMAGGLAALVASDVAYKREDMSVVSGAAKAVLDVAASKASSLGYDGNTVPPAPVPEPEPEPDMEF